MPIDHYERYSIERSQRRRLRDRAAERADRMAATWLMFEVIALVAVLLLIRQAVS